jgi:WD40 repeat protein
LPDRWFPNGIQQTLLVVPGKPQTVTFECEMPPPTLALSQVYPVALEATGRFPTVTATGQLHLLPAGTVRFTCEPLEAAIPELLGRWLNPTQGTAVFALQFDNLSNVQPLVELTVKELRSQRRRWFWQKQDPVPSPESIALPPGVSVGSLPSNLPLGVSAVPLQIQRRLPWLGWSRLRRFEVAAQTVDTQVPLQDSPQTLQVHLFPVIPLWLQLLGALLALGLGALTWLLLTDPGHRGPVNSVQFNGQGTEVVSSSDDQTIRRWRVQNQRLRTQTRIGNLTKAVRVVRYRPVNNDQVALGFENGEIQLANLLTGRRSRLTPDKDDRVFALGFSRDAQTLYSGHGSGLILQWDLSRFLPEQTIPQRAYDVRFAIEAIALSGNNYSHLAIGGRYNRLLLLTPQKDATKPTQAAQFLEIPYPSGGSTDYISSLSTADQQPNLLAVSDTQGRISVWNTDTCLTNRDRCTPIDKPWLGHEGSPVRAVALSADGCFLASAGDDGDVKLWSLDGQGARRSSAVTGRVLAHLSKPLNAVDVVQTRDAIWVTSGGDDGKVRLYEVRFAGNNRADDRCPVLSGGGS